LSGDSELKNSAKFADWIGLSYYW